MPDPTASAGATAMQVLDSPDPRHIAAQIGDLKAKGLKAVILYISPINPAGDKTAKKPAIDAIRATGVDVGFVCEGWGGSNNFAHQDINAACGARDGAMCAHWLEQLGAPDGTAVYPAVDNDASNDQIERLCVPYFIAFRAALGQRYRMGAYGCGALLQRLDQGNIISLRWLSNAMGWNGSRAYRDSNKWDILQGLATRVSGIDVDPDQFNPAKTDFGFWKADGTAPAVQAPATKARPAAKASVDAFDAAAAVALAEDAAARKA